MKTWDLAIEATLELAGDSRVRAQSAWVHLADSPLSAVIAGANAWRRALESGNVSRGREQLTRASWLSDGDVLTWAAMESDEREDWPEQGWTYGFRDRDCAVVWKPAGMPTSGNGGLNLACQMPGHPVHRLDKSTSGWLIVSQDQHITAAFTQAFARGDIQKSYLALAIGETPERLDIRLPLDGRPCRTVCQRIATGPWPIHGRASLLKIDLHTGRSHQIRRHLHAIGHGLVGEDRNWGGNGGYGNGDGDGGRAALANGNGDGGRAALANGNGNGGRAALANGNGNGDGGRAALANGNGDGDGNGVGRIYRGWGLFLSALQLSFEHPLSGEFVSCNGVIPRKFRKIRWAPQGEDLSSLFPS